MNENIIDNLLHRIMDVTGIESQTEFARYLNTNRSSINHARKRNKIPDRWIVQLYKKFGFNPKWIEEGTGKIFIKEYSFSDLDFTKIPKVDAVLSAGGGSLQVSERVDHYLSFPSIWLRSKGSIAAMVTMDVTGDSMEPDIKDGDIVLLDQSQIDIYNSKIYALRLDDALFIKKIEIHPDQLVLCSTNRAYSPIYIDKSMDNITILGRVIWGARDY